MNFKQNYTFQAITLKTAKLSDQFQFYVIKLGFQCLCQGPESFTIQCGKTELTFEESEQNCLYHFAFNIPENQIQESARWIKNHTDIIPFEDEEIIDFPNWNAHSLYFKDSAGNILEFIARHNLDNKSGNQFNINSIEEISEIGVPNPDIRKMLSLLRKNLNFEMYWGDLEKFAAIGHEKCLFITVPLKRAWFPTEDVISKIWPMKIELSDGINDKVLEIMNSDYYFLK